MTWATSEVVFERPFGRGADVALVGSDVGSGASPIAIPVPAGTTTGDIAVLGIFTNNSTPDVDGPSGGATWKELYRFETSSGEWHAVYWKVCGGSEPSDWAFAHSSGANVAVAAAVFRASGVDALHSFEGIDNNLQPQHVAGHPLGFQVLMYMDLGALTLPFGDCIEPAVDTFNVVIAYRDTTWAGDAIPVRCTGSNSEFTGAFNMVFSPS